MSHIDRPTLQRAPKLVARRCHCGDWAGFGFCEGKARTGDVGSIIRARRRHGLRLPR